MAKDLARWKPVHDQILALWLSGYEPEVISELTGVSVNTIRRVLNTPKAKKMVQEAQRRMRKVIMTGIGDKILTLAEKSVDNISETVYEKFTPGSKGKVHQDVVAFKLLEIVGFHKKDVNLEAARPLLSPENQAKLVEAITKSDRATEIHEAEYEIVE